MILLEIGRPVTHIEVSEVTDVHRVPGDVLEVPGNVQVELKLCRVSTTICENRQKYI